MTSPWPNPPQLPRPPRHVDPTGITFDRADIEGTDTVRPQPLGIGGWTPVKPCGCLAGDRCRCACQDTVDRIELDTVLAAPVIVLHPYNLRALREQHVTAAELHRREHGRGAA